MEENKRVVERDREVIQSFLITTARYSFSVYEKRILSLIVEHLQPTLEGEHLRGKIEKNLFNERVCSFSLKELCGDDTNRVQYYQALESLMDKKVRYENDEILQTCHIIQDLVIKKRSGIVRFTICETMAQIFLNFTKGYSKYVLSISLGLKRTTSARLYELISNQPHPMEYGVDKLKDILGVADTYPLTGNFIQRVLIPAKKELDEVANWSFDFKPIKGANGKYIKIQLIPIYQVKNEPQEVQRADALRRTHLSWFISNDVKYKLRDLGLGEHQIEAHKLLLQDFCAKFGYETIPKIQEIWARGSRRKKENQIGYLINAMKSEVENFNH